MTVKENPQTAINFQNGINHFVKLIHNKQHSKSRKHFGMHAKNINQFLIGINLTVCIPQVN